MYNKAVETIKKFNMLEVGDRVVVGLSGGADSCALVHVLSRLRDTMGIDITAVHINHGIRGEEAYRDEAAAEGFCKDLGVKFIAYHCNIPLEAKQKGIGEEEAGRLARYEKFREAAESVGARKIVVAHNLNDKTETLLINLFRGSGLKGLSGIQGVNGDIIRPLINCSRDEIEKYCADNGIKFCTDSTNTENNYTRNKLRNILLPWVKENINPSADMNIASAADLIREEEDYLEGLSEKEYTDAVIEHDENTVVLSSKRLLALHPVIRRRIIRIALRNMRSDLRDIGKIHTEKVQGLLEGDTGHKINLPGGLIAVKSYDRLEISKQKAESIKFCYDLETDEEYFIKEIGKCVTLSLNHEKKFNMAINVYTKKIDYDKIKGRIQLRTRRTGDYVSIKNGKKKLKDVFIDDKVPSDKRDSMPLIACGNSVILVGDRLGQDYYIKGNTKNVLYIYFWEDVNNDRKS